MIGSWGASLNDRLELMHLLNSEEFAFSTCIGYSSMYTYVTIRSHLHYTFQSQLRQLLIIDISMFS